MNAKFSHREGRRRGWLCSRLPGLSLLHPPYVGAQREHHGQETILAIVEKTDQCSFELPRMRITSISITVLKSCVSMHILQQNPTSRVDAIKILNKTNKNSVDARATQTDLRMICCVLQAGP